MKVAYLTPYCTTAGINAWLTYLIAGTRHKVAWVAWYTLGQYVGQRYMRPLCDVTFSGDIGVYLESVQPDIIHMTYHHQVFPSAMEHRNKYGTPIVVTLHGEHPKSGAIVDDLPKADAAVVPSQSMYEMFNAWEVLDNLRLIYHGTVDFSDVNVTPYDWRGEFGIPDEHMVVGWVGRLHKTKGWKSLMAVADMVADLPISFVLAGTGAPREVGAALGEVQRRPNMHYAGGITPYSMPSFYRGIDCGVSVSGYESFGLAVCEMAWESIPVVTLTAGGLDEVVGEKGILCQNLEEVASGLDYLRDPSCREKVGKALRRRVMAKKFTAARMGDEYIQLYKEVLARGIPIL